jgi:hypothetical protein
MEECQQKISQLKHQISQLRTTSAQLSTQLMMDHSSLVDVVQDTNHLLEQFDTLSAMLVFQLERSNVLQRAQFDLEFESRNSELDQRKFTMDQRFTSQQAQILRDNQDIDHKYKELEFEKTMLEKSTKKRPLQPLTVPTVFNPIQTQQHEQHNTSANNSNEKINEYLQQESQSRPKPPPQPAQLQQNFGGDQINMIHQSNNQMNHPPLLSTPASTAPLLTSTSQQISLQSAQPLQLQMDQNQNQQNQQKITDPFLSTPDTVSIYNLLKPNQNQSLGIVPSHWKEQHKCPQSKLSIVRSEQKSPATTVSSLPLVITPQPPQSSQNQQQQPQQLQQNEKFSLPQSKLKYKLPPSDLLTTTKKLGYDEKTGDYDMRIYLCLGTFVTVRVSASSRIEDLKIQLAKLRPNFPQLQTILFYQNTRFHTQLNYQNWKIIEHYHHFFMHTLGIYSISRSYQIVVINIKILSF